MAAPQPIRPVGATDHVDALPDAPPVPPVPQPQALTACERNALIGLQARAREYERIVNEAEAESMNEINARLGVVIGATHTIDPRTWTVVAVIPAPEGETAS